MKRLLLGSSSSSDTTCRGIFARTMGFLVHEITFWRSVAAVAIVAGLYATLVRFTQGLGASTNLSDEFPWGIWIGFDVLVGVGLAAGGFTITAAIHVFNLKRFEPIARPTILTAFLGYSLVIAGLLFDLGRPYRVWHPMVMGNPHSVLFEVGLCVSLYTTVLMLEFSPMVFERLKLHTPLKLIHGFTVPLVIAGVLLSTLHQSSLGTLYLIVPEKLHGLWYSPLLPVLFFLSAVAAGLSMVTLESFISSRVFGRRLELSLLADLARVVVVVLGVYLLVKLLNMSGRGTLRLLATPGPEQFLFLTEMVFGVVVPMVLLAIPAVRQNRTALGCSALLVVLGFVLNRLNVSLTGMEGGQNASYFPSALEVSVSAMLITAGVIAFGLAVKYLKVFPEEEHEPEPAQVAARPGISVALLTRGALAAFAGVLVLGAVCLDFKRGLEAGNPAKKDESVSVPEVELSLPADLKLLPGKESPGAVRFSHESHVSPAKPDCSGCHATLSLLADEGGDRRSGGKKMHEKPYCGRCHNGKLVFAVDSEDDCAECHVKPGSPKVTYQPERGAPCLSL